MGHTRRTKTVKHHIEFIQDAVRIVARKRPDAEHDAAMRAYRFTDWAFYWSRYVDTARDVIKQQI